MAAAIAELSRQTGVSVGTDGALPTVQARAVRGRLAPGEALRRMLAGTGYAARQVGPNAWRIVPQQMARPAQHYPPARPPALPPAQPPETISDQPIVVTASKDGETLGQVARSVAIYRPDAWRGQDARAGTADVAAAVNGLDLTGNGPGRNQIFLRGVADSPFSGSTQSTVAVLLDGVRLTWSAPDPDLRLVDVNRIEVLKGPQGTLYGQGALGGIYQIVTNRADPAQAEAAIGGGLSAPGDGGMGYSGSAMVNLPLARDRAALRLVGFAAHDGGWIDTGSRQNANAVRAIGGRAALALVPADDWRIEAAGMFQRLEAADTQYVYRPGARSRPAQQAEPHDNDLDHLALRVEGRLGGAELVALTGLTWHEVRERFDASIGADQLGLRDPALFDYDRHYRVWDNELRLSGGQGGLHWLVGLSHVDAWQNTARSLSATSPAPPLLLDSSTRTSSDTALFANVVVPVGNGLSLEGGGRVFRGVIEDRRTYVGQFYQRDLRRVGITPGAALSWRPHLGRVLFLRYGSALRQGGLGMTAAGQVQPVDGDELTTFEAGWRERLGHGGSLDVTAFYALWSDVQSDMPLANGLIETRNAGNARIAGAEAALDVAIGSGWRSGLSATVQDARLVRNNLGLALEDRRLPVVPSYTARAWLRRDFNLGTASGWARATLRAVGPARLSFDPAIDRPMGNFRELGAELHVTHGALEWGLELSNILGGNADTFSAGNPLRILTVPQYTPQRPSRISALLVMRF